MPSVSGDSLYVCLDIPAVKTPAKRNVLLSYDVLAQVPAEIKNMIEQQCDRNQIELNTMDYELNLRKSNSSQLYRNAPVEEIIHFASIGTRIAFQILDATESGREQPWATHKELAYFIRSQLERELGADYFWFREAFHFVCNPLLLNDSYLWTLVNS